MMNVEPAPSTQTCDICSTAGSRLAFRPSNSQQDLDRIAGERSREDEALQGHKKPSLWKRLLGRRGHDDVS